MKTLKRLGFSVLIVSALAAASLAAADTTSISTDANGVTTQSHSTINGTAKVEHMDYNSGAIQDSLRFKQTGVATTTPPEQATGGNNGNGGTESAANANAQAIANANANAAFSVSRFDLERPRASTIIGVDTNSEFETYARSVINSDEFLSSIESSDTGITVAHYQPTKLMGIINALVLVRVHVDASGSVTVTYPVWYTLFGKADEAADFRNDMRVAINALGFDRTTATMNAANQAAVVNAISTFMARNIEKNAFGTTTEAIVR